MVNRRAAAIQLMTLFTVMVLFASKQAINAADLPSWTDSPAKRAIVSFVARVTDESSRDFVAPGERIAVFDNDGTLWAEQPMYFQLLFAIERVRQLAPQHPQWKDQEPFASLLKGDMQAALAGGEKAILDIVMATHAGMTTEEFEKIVKDWITAARHPTTGRRYTEMVYQPMLELLAYLRANGFKTYIVSGGGIEFLRVFAEEIYGVPPEQVVGSSIKTRFEVRNGKPVLIRLPELNFIDDKAGKPVGFTNTSDVVRLPRLATPTVTYKCCSGPLPEMALDSACSSITPTQTGNGPMIVSLR